MKKKLTRRALSALLFAAGAMNAMLTPSIQLDAATAAPTVEAGAADADKAVWVQVAREGTYKGHARGEFTLNAQVFGQLIQNFRNHPSYKRGADGYGMADVIPFDWRHASEQPVAAGGQDPLATQAAYGWARDLEMRRGDDGKIELWALSSFLPETKEAIRAGRVKWTSIAIWPNATDPVKGNDIGWYMSSIALTNDPFIQGMTPITADRAGSGRVVMGRYYDPYPPRSVQEMLERLRDLFGLPELSDLKTVIGQILTLKAIVAGEKQAPAGVEVEELVGCLRCIFNLPVLASPDDVFAEAAKLEAALAAEEAIEEVTEPPSQPNPKITADRGTPAPAPTQENNTMDPKTLIALIAGALGLPGTASPEDVQKKFDEHLALARKNGERLVLLAKAGDDMADDAGGDSGGALAKLKALLTHAGVKDPDSAMKGLTENYARLKQMEKDLPELAEMYARQLSREEQSVTEDVRATFLERYNADPSSDEWKNDPDVQVHVGALTAERIGWRQIDPALLTAATLAERLKTDPGVREHIKGVLASRETARSSYLTKYPRLQPQPGQPAPSGPQNPGAALFTRYFGGTAGGAPQGHPFQPQPQPQGFGGQGWGAQGAGNPMGGAAMFGGAQPGFGGQPAMFGMQPGMTPIGIGPGAGQGPAGEPQIDLAALQAMPGANLSQKAIALYRQMMGPQGAQMDFDTAFNGGRTLLAAAHRQAQARGITL